MWYIRGKTELLDVIIDLVIQEEFNKIIVLYLYLGLNDTHVFFSIYTFKGLHKFEKITQAKNMFLFYHNQSIFMYYTHISNL